jgi:hypothetical protein
MNARTLRWLPLLGACALSVAGANTASAQPPPQAQPQTGARAVSKQIEADRKLWAELAKEADDARYELDHLDAWIRLGEAREAELREGSRVALVGDTRTVFMDTSALRASVRRHVLQWTMDEFRRTGDYTLLQDIGDADAVQKRAAELEADVLKDSENYRQWLVLDLAEMRRRRRSQEMRFLLNRMRMHSLLTNSDDPELERSYPEAQSQPAGRRDLGSTYPSDLGAEKRRLGLELDDIRKAGHWSADHHMQVGTFIGVARTLNELYSAARMMYEYAACYDTKNLRRASVLANDRTGMYKTPGERIAALDEIGVDFNTCIGKAEADFQRDRGR